jgi:hypothetical protein
MTAAQAPWSPLANGTLMARRSADRLRASDVRAGSMPLSCGYMVERVTRIEPALSAWEDDGTPYVRAADLHVRLAMSDRD